MAYYINILVFLTLSFLLVACKTAGFTPVEVVTAPVPVAVPCMEDPPPRPVWKLNEPDARDQVTFIKQALHDALIAKGYTGELEAVLAGCE